MADGAEGNSIRQTVEIGLDAATYAALAVAAQEHGTEPAMLVERWVRERLAHESERRLGRERPQRLTGN